GALGDGVFGIDVVIGVLPFEPCRDTILPGATHDCLEPVGILRSDDCIMQRYNATAALQKLFEVDTLFAEYPARVSGEHDENIGVFQFLGGWKTQRALNLGAARFQKRLPLLEPCWAIVLAVGCGSVCLWSASEENAQRRLLLGYGSGSGCRGDQGGGEDRQGNKTEDVV